MAELDVEQIKSTWYQKRSLILNRLYNAPSDFTRSGDFSEYREIEVLARQLEATLPGTAAEMRRDLHAIEHEIYRWIQVWFPQ